MYVRLAKPLEYIMESMQKRKESGQYTIYVVDFKLVNNIWCISYGVKNTITGVSDLTDYEAFDMEHNVAYVRDKLQKYGFYIRQAPGAMFFIKPIVV